MKNRSLNRSLLLARIAALSLGLAGLALFAPAAAAATWTVTTIVDDTGVPGNCPGPACSLRDAIAAASAGDTITFDPSLAGSTIAQSGVQIVNKNLTINGGSPGITVQGSGLAGTVVFSVSPSVTVTLDSLIIKNGNGSPGGGIYNHGDLTLINCVVSDNQSTLGGGIFSLTGTLTLINSTVSGNKATLEDGGGIAIGGGTRSLTLINSTVSGNTAAFAGGGISINVNGVSDPSVVLINSTVANNTDDYGEGGISVRDIGNSPNITLINSTLSGNAVSDLGTDRSTNSIWILTNTIIGACAPSATTNLVDNGGNLDGGSNCGLTAATSLSNATLDLGALADNGGTPTANGTPPLTMLPNAGSAAITQGLASACGDSATVGGVDQRSAVRSTTACTSGAVEYLYALTVQVTGNGEVSETASNPSITPAQIDACATAGGTPCTGNYPYQDSVTLSATPAAGETFIGWGAACASAGTALTATMTMSVARNCTARFTGPNTAANSIPALGHWALLLLTMLTAGGAARRLRQPLRRK